MATGSAAAWRQTATAGIGLESTAEALTERLRLAIDRAELSVAFQPQVRAADGGLYGFEALVRWRLPDGTDVPPALFVPLAEESEAIQVLGDWVLRRACTVAARWRDGGAPAMPVAVNVSPRQLGASDIAGSVMGVLADTGLPAENLKLELTETAQLPASPALDAKLAALQAAGVRLVLDDFGTGYSSLALLRRIPVEALKIDRQFVTGMVQDDRPAVIVHAVIALAHALGIEAVAEGVETRDELLVLRAFRCDRIQGYLIAHPMTEAQVPEFIARTAAPRTGG